MLKRLERDAIKADLAAVEALLKGRTQDEDPVGFFQFSRRIEELNHRLSDLDLAPTANSEVALFFGGKPVVGSHGIQADFGAAAIADFQNLVSSAFAAVGGTLGARGPVPGTPPPASPAFPPGGPGQSRHWSGSEVRRAPPTPWQNSRAL